MSDQRYRLHLANEYGCLEVRRINGEYFVELDNYTGPTRRPISEALARMLCAELALPDDHYCSDQEPLFPEVPNADK